MYGAHSGDMTARRSGKPKKDEVVRDAWPSPLAVEIERQEPLLCRMGVQNVTQVTLSTPLYPDCSNRAVSGEMYETQSATIARRATRGHPKWSRLGVPFKTSWSKVRQ